MVILWRCLVRVFGFGFVLDVGFSLLRQRERRCGDDDAVALARAMFWLLVPVVSRHRVLLRAPDGDTSSLFTASDGEGPGIWRATFWALVLPAV